MARTESDAPRPSAQAFRVKLRQVQLLAGALLLLGQCSGQASAASLQGSAGAGAGGSHSASTRTSADEQRRPRLHFPMPASAAVCPSFSRYTRLHRAALGQLDPLPGLISGHNARHHGAGALLEGPRYTHGHSHHATGAADAATPAPGGQTGPFATVTGHRRDRLLATEDAGISSSSSTSTTTRSSSGGTAAAGAASATAMRQPRSKARWLVTLDPDGIADRLVNAVSSFYLALLTDRVLCVLPAYDHGYQPGLEAAFTPGPNIDWTCGRQPSAAELERRRQDAEQAGKEGSQGEVAASKGGRGAAAPSGALEAEDPAAGEARQLRSTGRLLRRQRRRRVLAEEGEKVAEEAEEGDAGSDAAEEAEEGQEDQPQAASGEEEQGQGEQEQAEAAAPPPLDPAPLPPLVDMSDVAYWNPTADDAWMDPGFPIYTQFVRSRLDRIGPYNATTLVLRMHRGISVALFNNPHHRRQMEAMGLRPDTAFGCAVAYLFGSLNEATRALAAAEPRLHALMTDESAIKIGIQIRLGDAKILAQLQGDNQTAALDEASRKVVDGFLTCAATLAASVTGLSGPEGAQPETGHQAAGDRVAPGDTQGLQQLLSHGGSEYDHFRQQQQQAEAGGAAPPPPPPRPAAPPAGPPLRIYFYLMTDTLAVRQAAQEKFGDALLYPPQSAVEFYQHVTDDGLRRTVLEHWYFSRCHHHVITGHSGMGRTAAFGSLRPGPSLYSMEISDGTRMAGRGCEVWDADRPLDVYNTWSGV